METRNYVLCILGRMSIVWRQREGLERTSACSWAGVRGSHTNTKELAG